MNKLLVLIAQAHAKSTPGKRSPDGRLREYAYSREICKMIVESLYSKGIKSIIINPEVDEEVKLSVQASRANAFYDKYKKDYEEVLLISPHVNAAASSYCMGGWSNASGWCGYVYTKASAKSRKIAKIISDLAYSNEYNLKGNRWVGSLGYFEANFTILKNTKMPALLTENLFMTNKKEVDFLLSDEGKKKIVELHVNAILKYIEN